MRLNYNKYTITLDRLTTMIASQDIDMIKRYKLVPNFLRNMAFKKLMKDYTEMFGVKADDLTTNAAKYKLVNMLNRLEMLLIMKEKNIITDTFKSEFKALIRKPYTDKSTIKDIENKIKVIAAKLKAMLPVEEETQTDGVTLTQIIVSVEQALNVNISMDIKLFQFYEIYQKSLKTVE